MVAIANKDMIAPMSNDYDILLIGAGLVGTSLINALQGLGLRIAVLEKNLPEMKTSTTRDTRPLSLAYSSHTILKTLGLWSELAAGASPIRSVHVSEQHRFGQVIFDAEEYGLPALGYVVGFDELHRVLYERAAQQDGVEFIAIQSLQQIETGLSGACVTFEDVSGTRTLSGALLVGADGTRSPTRALCHIETDTQDRHELAFTAKLNVSSEHQHRAYERFTDRGTLALLPLHNTRHYRMVWSMGEQEFRRVETWDDERFRSHLQDVFGERIGRIESLTRGQQFPLQTVIAKEQVRDGLVLLGNAAHTLYPLAAQGFNLGLRDVALLAEIIQASCEQGMHLGECTQLQRYVDLREKDQNRILRLTRGVADLFTLQLPVLNTLRGLSLMLMELVPPMKRRVFESALGLSGHVAKLARGVPLITGEH